MLLTLLTLLVSPRVGDEIHPGTKVTAQLARPDAALELKLFAAGDVTLAVESLDFDVAAKLATSSGGVIEPRARWQVAGDEHLVFQLPDTGPFVLKVTSEDDLAGEFSVTAQTSAAARPDGDAIDRAQIEHWSAAAERALARGAPERATELLWTAAERRWRRKEPEATRDLLYRMLDVPGAGESKPFGPLARMYLGLCELRLGSAEVALPLIDGAANEIDLLGVPDRTVEVHSALAEIHIGGKRYERADQELARCAEAIAQMEPEDRPDFEQVLQRRAEVRQDLAYLQSVLDPHAAERAFVEAVAEIDRRLAAQPELAGLKLPPAPPDLLARLRSKLGPGELLVLYAEGTSFCFEHLVKSSANQVVSRSKSEIAALASYGTALQAEGKSAESSKPRNQLPFQERSVQTEIEFLGKTPQRWIVVPTPELAAAPFDAIVAPRTSKTEVRYLVDDARVDVIPSASLLLADTVPLRESPAIVEVRFGKDALDTWARALATARDGKQAVLITLWDCPELRAAFESKLGRGGMGAAEALQAAKVEMRAKPNYAAPRYWAGLRTISAPR